MNMSVSHMVRFTSRKDQIVQISGAGMPAVPRTADKLPLAKAGALCDDAAILFVCSSVRFDCRL